MTPRSIAEALAGLPDWIVRTNPAAVLQYLDTLGPTFPTEYQFVWRHHLHFLLQVMAQRGVAVRREEVDDLVRRHKLGQLDRPKLVEPAPRVVGLVVRPGDDGFARGVVLPLRAPPADAWSAPVALPFDEGRVVADHLKTLLATLGPEVLLERFAFRIEADCGRTAIRGRSLDVAGLLAVLDAAGGYRAPLLRGACATVEPGPDGSLCVVGDVRNKLAAFEREYGHDRGALLVHHPEDREAQAFVTRGVFKEGVPVASWEELARFLHGRGLLHGLLNGGPLTTAEVRRLDARANQLLTTSAFPEAARQLVELAVEQGFACGVPIALQLQFRRRSIGASIQLGRPEDAMRVAREVASEVDRLGDLTSVEDAARAATAHAATLFALHDFDAAAKDMASWAKRLARTPRLLPVDTRVAVFNTLARAEAMRPGASTDRWVALFRRSLALQAAVDPEGMARTRVYLVHGLLRAGKLEDACRELDAPLKGPATDLSRCYLAACRADLARRERTGVWTDSDLEAQEPPRRLGFPFGWYLLATARQEGRNGDDARCRMARARAFFHDENPTFLGFLRDAVRLLEAAAAADPPGWAAAAASVATFLRASPRHHAWYKDVWRNVPEQPSRPAAEALLERIPYL